MIPQAPITAWGRHAPWPNEDDIEQDLILSRLMVEIANNDRLGNELAMRGGTCLHKLHLPKPLRYSEDLDYVRSTRSEIGPYMDELRRVATDVGLDERSYKQTEQMVHMIFVADSASRQRSIRIKIETNVRETEPCFDRVTRDYSVESSWWSGKADIRTFELNELMGTKLRALYQRRKGRDLFDLWYVLNETGVDDARIITALTHYMGAGVFSYPNLAKNLVAKLDNSDFLGDLDDLIAAEATDYDPVAAADLVMERLASRLNKAPGLDEIQGGLWRESR